MAVDRNAQRAVFSASGDIITEESLGVASIIVETGSGTGEFIIKEGTTTANEYFRIVNPNANTPIYMEYPFGCKQLPRGMQTGTIPTNGRVTVIFS